MMPRTHLSAQLSRPAAPQGAGQVSRAAPWPAASTLSHLPAPALPPRPCRSLTPLGAPPSRPAGSPLTPSGPSPPNSPLPIHPPFQTPPASTHPRPPSGLCPQTRAGRPGRASAVVPGPSLPPAARPAPSSPLTARPARRSHRAFPGAVPQKLRLQPWPRPLRSQGRGVPPAQPRAAPAERGRVEPARRAGAAPQPSPTARCQRSGRLATRIETLGGASAEGPVARDAGGVV